MLRNKGQVFINNLDTGKNLDAGPEVNGASAKNIEAFMQESAMDTLKIALSILAPLLGSILPDMIHF